MLCKNILPISSQGIFSAQTETLHHWGSCCRFLSPGPGNHCPVLVISMKETSMTWLSVNRLLSLSRMFSRLILMEHLSVLHIPFNSWIVHYMYTTPFNFWWTLRLFPLFGDYEGHCYEWACIHMGSACAYSSICFRIELVCNMGIMYVQLSEECQATEPFYTVTSNPAT